ncbi:MAG: protease modulator HflK [Pseudomonadota bacterium]
MQIFDGFKQRFGQSAIGLAMAGKKNPWGAGNKGGDEASGEKPSGQSGDEPSGEKSEGPRNPWLPGGGSGDGAGGKGRRAPNIEDLFKNRGPEGPRRGGPGGPNFRLPQRPGGKSWAPILIVGVALIWIGLTSVHFVQPREQAVVTWFGGKYQDTLNPGTNWTYPWPVQQVTATDVSEIRSEDVPKKLILTGDQNLVDLGYLIRWNIKDLTLFEFQLADPEETVLEAAETAMRSSVAEKTLDAVISGEGRADIEQNVLTRMQGILDAYGSGINVQGIEIDKSDPPEQVIEAFNDVLAAQQNAEQEINQARRYAQQLLARAEGDAAAFNNIYEEYRLAPEVTRRRLYYETMEAVLANTDKTFIEADGVTPYLPLSEVQRRSQQAASQAQQGGQ